MAAVFPPSCRALTGPGRRAGFTLLELLIVIAILGVVLAVAYPRFSGVSESYLRADAGRVSSLVRYLNEASASKKAYYRLWFDMEKNELRVEVSKDGVKYAQEPEAMIRRLKLSEGVDIEDITLPELGKVNTGEAAVVFAPAGSLDPFTLRLGASGKSVSLSFNPYSGAFTME